MNVPLTILRAAFIIVAAGIATILDRAGYPWAQAWTPYAIFAVVVGMAIVVVLADVFTPTKQIDTISAVYFERYEVLEEAFRLGAEAHLLAGQKGVYPPLAPVVATFNKQRMLQASLLTSLGEQMLTKGELPAASAALSQARNTVGRREMASGAIGCRLNFATARGAMHGGDLLPSEGSGERRYRIKAADEPCERVVSEVELNEPSASGYSVTLPTFEGPLDLLLHLCQKHELDVLDIPIGFVTEKYLEYLAVMQLINLDVASEY